MPAGRPAKYNQQILDKAKNWIENYEISYDTPVTITKDGKTVEKMVEKANLPPFDMDLAKYLNIARQTYYRWVREHKEFSDTIKELKNKFEEVLVKNALAGHYNPAFAIFTAKNCIGWKDKHEIEQTNYNFSDDNVELLKGLGKETLERIRNTLTEKSY